MRSVQELCTAALYLRSRVAAVGRKPDGSIFTVTRAEMELLRTATTNSWPVERFSESALFCGFRFYIIEAGVMA